MNYAMFCYVTRHTVIQKLIQNFREMYYFALVYVLLGETFFFSHVSAVSCSLSWNARFSEALCRKPFQPSSQSPAIKPC